MEEHWIDSLLKKIKALTMKEEISEFEKIQNTESYSTGDEWQNATRNNFQWGRRLFHMSSGVIIATSYNLFLTHQQIIYFLGTIACLLYLFEQIRINYPEYADKFSVLSSYFLRAEEQLKESSAIPYAIAILLTILSFPKVISLIAIYTLAIGDPISAIVGIKFGRHKISKRKSVEGSIGFFVATFLCALTILSSYAPGLGAVVWFASFLIALFGCLFEMIPLRIDDNLTIPLFIAFSSWIICGFLGFPIP